MTGRPPAGRITVPTLPLWLETLKARLPTGLGDAGRHARVVQSLPLGPGTRLLVVEFGGRRLLIGQARTGLVGLGEAAVGDTATGATATGTTAIGPAAAGGAG